VESTDENPQQYVGNRELGDQIEQAIGTLRPEYRTAVLLCRVEGYAYEEIAEIVDLPLGAVYFPRDNLEVVANTAQRNPMRAGLVGLAGAFLVLPTWVLGCVALVA
jgi:hypothetical protein